MGYRFSAPIENEFNTFITRFDYLIDRGGNHKLFFRAGKQDDTDQFGPAVRGPGAEHASRSTRTSAMRWAMTPCCRATWSTPSATASPRSTTSTVGLRKADAVTFRFITDFDALTSTNGREVPTHNIVNDMSWLKGNHNVKFGTNIRFTRAPKYSNANSFHTGNLNPVVGRGHRPQLHARQHRLREPAVRAASGGRLVVLLRLRRSVADAARRHLAADGELQLRQDRHRAAERRAGAPHLRDRRVRVLRPGQLAAAPEPDRDRPACATTCTRRPGRSTASSWRRRFRSATGSSSGERTC